jgi:hypothetical protein
MGVQKISIGNGNLTGGATRAEGLAKLEQFNKQEATGVLQQLRTNLISANNRPKHGVLKLVNSAKSNKEMAFTRRNGLDRWWSKTSTFENTTRALGILLQKSGLDETKAQQLLQKAQKASGLNGQIKYDAATDMIDEALAFGQRQQDAKDAISSHISSSSTLAPKTVKTLYEKYQVPVSKATLPGAYSPASNLERVGGGQISDVYRGRFKFGGTEAEYFYKAMSPAGASAASHGVAADTIGIDSEAPQVGCRNIATGLVDKLLGFGVTAESRFVVLGQNDDNRRLGLLMDKAVGRDPAGLRDVRDDLRANPTLRRDLTKLQLLDAVVGQADRHQGNYIIDYDVKTKSMKGLKGIDNDACFGKKTLDPSELVYRTNRVDQGMRGVSLPKVIDASMQAAILTLTPQALEKELQPLLSQREVDAAKARLGAVQQHVNDNRKCRVIAASEWGTPEITAILQRGGAQASYIGRDFY